MATARRKEFCPSYFAGLVGPTRARYEEKVTMCDGVDPYTLCAGTDTAADVELLPVTTHADIVNYLVLSTNYVSLAEMKAYKALEAHNYFTSGRVSGMTAMRLPSKRVIVLSEVGHSQRLREAPLKAWILADSDGSICSAHCTCMAGAGEACSHVGATLFAMETAVRIRESQTCTQKTNVWLPAHRSGTEYKRLRDIDFASSKKKKSRMDALPEMPFDEQVRTGAPALPPPTAEELGTFYSSIDDGGLPPAIFMVLPEYSDRFVPPRSSEPPNLRQLLCHEAQSENLPQLVSRAQGTIPQLAITDEMVRHAEGLTRQQAKCPAWFKYRAGRVTASIMKSVCSTTTTQPSISLVKKICYPEQNRFSTAATQWGIDHEEDAIAEYVAVMKTCHTNFGHNKTGVFLSTKYPHLAASPDGTATCSCCGKGLIEVKCPHTAAHTTAEQAAVNNADFCLEAVNGKLQLKHGHAYYYQIQTQLAVCDFPYCDFVVWTPLSLHIERVLQDKAFFDTINAAASNFFVRVILPELLSGYFTKRSLVSASAGTFCYCQGPEQGRMLACDGKSCKYGWFHYSCIGIKRAPKQKQWFCDDCSSLDSSQQ